MTKTLTPIKKHKKPRQKRRLSAFGLACTIIAAIYIGYRVFLVAVPGGFAGAIASPPHQQKTTCEDADEATQSDHALSIFSSQYQSRLATAPHTSKNLVANSTYTNYNVNVEAPRGWSQASDVKYIDYDYRQDEGKDKTYLRAHPTKNVMSKDGTAGWIMDPITMGAGKTYSYSLDYRTDVAASVSIEWIKGGKSTYESITELKPSQQWQRFTSHITNTTGAEKFRFYATIEKVGTLDVRNFSMYQIPDAALAGGMVTIAFDDGWQSIYDHAEPLLTKYKIPTTQYVISEAANEKMPNYMTTKTLQKMKKAGHEIGSHSLLHCDQAHIPEKDVAQNATGSKQMLEGDKLGPIESFAYPFGSYNDKSQQVISPVYGFVRTSDFGYNDRYFDRYNIRSIAVTDKTTDQEFAGWLKYAKAHKLWVVIVYHRVGESGHYNVSKDQLEKQLQMVQQSGLPVLPLSQAAKSALQQ